MKKIITITLSIIYLTTNGQNELDVLRYSQDLGLFGSARSAAIGNAFGAMGGDFSSLSNNPAGIGLYQFNEFTFTPAFGLNSTVSDKLALQTMSPLAPLVSVEAAVNSVAVYLSPKSAPAAVFSC